jgi:hypothetical protein
MLAHSNSLAHRLIDIMGSLPLFHLFRQLIEKSYCLFLSLEKQSETRAAFAPQEKPMLAGPACRLLLARLIARRLHPGASTDTAQPLLFPRIPGTGSRFEDHL